MIDFISKYQAVALMNKLGKERKDFLFAFDYELSKAFVISSPMEQKEILFSVNGCTNIESFPKKNKVKICPHFVDYSFYKKGFELVKNSLLRGDTYLANYTVQTPIETTNSLQEIFYSAKSPFKLYVPDAFVCFSPERFVKIENDKIFTFPMKGTIDARLPQASTIILNDKKETAEHITIVDLLRNDIGMVANNVRVERFRYIDEIKTDKGSILQVSSEMVGDLDKNWYSCLGNIILKLLPAGSICGAPKQSTIRAIAKAEKKKRGFYTGVFGYFDGNRLDSAVLIRFIEKNGNNYFFRSGGGITVNSDCKKEYDEVNQKIYLPL